MLVEIYYKPGCPYCEAAEKLLNSLLDNGQRIRIKFYRDCLKGTECYEELKRRSYNHNPTYPQIFVDRRHLGGYTELVDRLKNKKGML